MMRNKAAKNTEPSANPIDPVTKMERKIDPALIMIFKCQRSGLRDDLSSTILDKERNWRNRSSRVLGAVQQQEEPLQHQHAHWLHHRYAPQQVPMGPSNNPKQLFSLLHPKGLCCIHEPLSQQ
jgi:hypothetical protein